MDGLEPSTLYARAWHACPEPNLDFSSPARNRHEIRLHRQASPTNAQFSLDAIHSNYRREEEPNESQGPTTSRSEPGIPTKIQNGHSV